MKEGEWIDSLPLLRSPPEIHISSRHIDMHIPALGITQIFRPVCQNAHEGNGSRPLQSAHADLIFNMTMKEGEYAWILMRSIFRFLGRSYLFGDQPQEISGHESYHSEPL